MPFPALLFTLLVLTAAGNGSDAASSGVQQADHIQVELISEMRTVRAGEPFWVALRLVPDPGWHTYWRNPGDSGLETRIRWTLPEG
jgi:DsbC/DsbD-like thiol-disulfide interchange protein